jgi:hypothetical protein
MLNRKESKILIMQRKSAGLLAVVSVAMLSVGFAGTGALSASANNAPAPQSAVNRQFAVSTWHRPKASRNPRYFGYAAPGLVFAPGKSVPDNGCDLPSTGCPNYLSN